MERRLARTSKLLTAANRQGRYLSPQYSEHSLETIQNIKHIVNKSGTNSKLGKVTHMPNGRASVCRTPSEPAKTLGNWARCKVLHPRVGPKVRLYALGGDCLSNNGLERSWCADGSCAEHEPIPQGYVNKWSSVVGLPWEDCGWQMKGSDVISSGVLGLGWFFFFLAPLLCSRVI